MTLASNHSGTTIGSSQLHKLFEALLSLSFLFPSKLPRTKPCDDNDDDDNNTLMLVEQLPQARWCLKHLIHMSLFNLPNSPASKLLCEYPELIEEVN